MISVERAFTSDKTSAWLIALVATCAGALLTLAIANAVQSFYQHQLQQRFAWAASEHGALLQVQLDERSNDLEGLRRFFSLSDEVVRAEFSGYTKPLLKDALVIAWMPVVVDARRADVEHRAQAEGYANFIIQELNAQGQLVAAGLRSSYVPLLFIESKWLKQLPLGLDMSFSVQRQELLNRAAETGALAVSSALTLIDPALADVKGLLLVAAVCPGRLAEPHCSGLSGYVTAVLSLHDLMELGGKSDSHSNLSVELSNTEAGQGEALLYRSEVAPAADSELLFSRTLELGDRHYQLSIRPTNGFLHTNRSPGMAVIWGSGGLLSLMLAALLYSLVSQRQRAQVLVRKRTAELRQREHELRLSEERWAFAVEGSGDGVWDWDLQTDKVYYSDVWKSMLGYASTDISDDIDEWRSRVHADDLPTCLAHLQQHYLGIEPFFCAELRMRNKDGSWQWVLTRGKVMEWQADGTPKRILGMHTDISESKKIREALQARDRLLERLTQHIPGALFQFLQGVQGVNSFPYVSVGVRDIYELDADALRLSAESFFARLHPDDLERVKTSLQRSAQLLRVWREDYRVLLPHQGLRWVRSESTPERLASGDVLWHGYSSDITGLKLVEAELRTLSVTDALTGAFNRRYFQERLEAEITRAMRSKGSLAVVMLDIDHFKQVNDAFGHAAGDRVLKSFCQRISQRLRRIDVLCRLGGEEFIVLCPDTDVQQALNVAEALWRALRTEPIEGVGVVTASFGVAAWQEGESIDSLLRRVDASVYAAKQAGRDRIQAALPSG